MPVTIATKDLVKKYGSRTVVNHVSFEVKQGEIVGLLGPNGAGKTTSFYQVVGLVKPDQGQVFLNNEDITRLPMYKRAKMGIGYLPQEASVFRKLSVEDNISAILEMTGKSKQEQKDKLESLLNEFRLQHVRKSNGDVLSGGERRRTEIARALSVDPKFILLDEPFAGIDPIAVEDIQAIVAKLKYKNIGILITDHNVTETLSICDRAYLLIEGRIYKHGTAEELAADEEVRRLYLGRNFELRRKDYLHEEAQLDQAQQGTNSENKFEYVVEKCVIESGKKANMLNKMLGPLSTHTGADLDISTYAVYLNSVRSSLLNKYSHHKDISNLALKIPFIDPLKYKKTFRVHDALIIPSFYLSFLGIGLISFIPLKVVYRPIFRELYNKISDAKSLLDEIRLMLHAENH